MLLGTYGMKYVEIVQLVIPMKKFQKIFNRHD